MSNETKATLPATIPDWIAATAFLPALKVQLVEPKHSPTRHLSVIERATIRIATVPIAELPLGQGIVHEAAFRFAMWERDGILPHASGTWVAGQLQAIYWPERWNATRYARRGWVLLAALDAADVGVTVHLSAEPLNDPYGHFRRMRLHERLTELRCAERDQGAVP